MILNRFIFNGQSQEINFNTDNTKIIGTGAAETINFAAGINNVFFTAGEADHIRFVNNFEDYTITASGNQLLFEDPNGKAITLIVNSSSGNTSTVEFTDGEADLYMSFGAEGPQIHLGDTVLRDGETIEAPGDLYFLTVTEEQLRAAVDDGTYAIEENGIVYTFEDSEYNIDTSQIINMSFLFRGTWYEPNEFNGDIGYWDVSNVTDMGYMFYEANSFNQDIGEWDVSNVTNMSGMFGDADSFNQNIGNWDVSNVSNMWGAFSGAESFNQDIGDWDVSNVTDMGMMFHFADSFNQDIGEWDVSNVSNMRGMFGTVSFNQDIGDWDVSNVTDMGYMFYNADSFNQDLSGWDIPLIDEKPTHFATGSPLERKEEYHPKWGEESNGFYTVTEEQLRAAVDDETYAIEENGIVYTFEDSEYNIDTSQIINMSFLFSGTWEEPNKFNGDIGYWDVSNVRDMRWMFAYNESFNQDIGEWDVSNVMNMRTMFYEAHSFNQDIGDWDVSNVMSMSSMFRYANSFNQNIGDWNVSNVTTMRMMFDNANSFNQNIGDWNISNVMDMTAMFFWAYSFDQDIGNWDVSNVTDMYAMFWGAKSFNQDIGNWDVSKVMDMNYMFYEASSFDQDISGWHVPLIDKKPSDFVTGSPLEGKEEYYPRWGKEPQGLYLDYDDNFEIFAYSDFGGGLYTEPELHPDLQINLGMQMEALATGNELGADEVALMGIYGFSSGDDIILV